MSIHRSLALMSKSRRAINMPLCRLWKRLIATRSAFGPRARAQLWSIIILTSYSWVTFLMTTFFCFRINEALWLGLRPYMARKTCSGWLWEVRERWNLNELYIMCACAARCVPCCRSSLCCVVDPTPSTYGRFKIRQASLSTYKAI